ncbi:MAG TPA: acyl-CoA dehydrogenase family protein [Alphaproteobacteria bacterium]|nr:acyl-CoA dehydrogenase family protein [Alphaproteobacteria bacterium]
MPELSEDIREIQNTFARFCDEQIAPRAEAIDEAAEFPREMFQAIADLGFFGMRYPEEVGGLGLGLLAYCKAIEEIARGSMSVAACVSMQAMMGTNFVHALGTPDHHERLLKPALEGKKIGSICITEPNAGTDLGSISTSAVEVEGGYRLNGQKMWVTLAPHADFFTVFARAGEEKKLTIFLLEKGFEGLDVGRAIHKMGVRALPTSELAINDCFVPAENRLGEIGAGELELRKILAQIRIMTGSLAVGCARAALADALRYSSERQQFGRPIGKFQAIQMKLAEMATDLKASMLLVDDAARLFDEGRPHHKEAAMAKLFATEAALEICEKTARIYASYGYAMEYPVQRHLRDIRFTLIGGGTSEILKAIIAHEVQAEV